MPALRAHKTRIVCTLGPASERPAVLEAVLRAGMDVARVNLSHGEPDEHARRIAAVRAAAAAVGRRVAVLADLPGPKLRIGDLAEEPIRLAAGEEVVLAAGDARPGDRRLLPVALATLPEAVRPGSEVFLNDGLLRLEVEAIEGRSVRCRVRVGGELRSRKGLNLPGASRASLGIPAVTDRDRELLDFALGQGVDLIGQSFVETAEDVRALREAGGGRVPFVLAKIERARALDHIEEILAAADGLLIARGDLGVEIPIEDIATVQKRLVRLANLYGKPVVTATQMLESMTSQPRPTRAEATDVANAILDGSDAVMLSAESAVGRYPVEAVEMLAKIAASIERHHPGGAVRQVLRESAPGDATDLVALSVDTIASRTRPLAIFVPTQTGSTARRVARFRPEPWIVAVSTSAATCQQLQLTSGVVSLRVEEHPDDWNAFARDWLAEQRLEGRFAVLTEGPSPSHPDANPRIELLDLARPAARGGPGGAGPH